MNYGNQGAMMGGLLGAGPARGNGGYGGPPPADMGTGYGMGRNMASRPQGFAPASPSMYGNGGQFGGGGQGFQGQFGFGDPGMMGGVASGHGMGQGQGLGQAAGGLGAGMFGGMAGGNGQGYQGGTMIPGNGGPGMPGFGSMVSHSFSPGGMQGGGMPQGFQRAPTGFGGSGR